MAVDDAEGVSEQAEPSDEESTARASSGADESPTVGDYSWEDYLDEYGPSGVAAELASSRSTVSSTAETPAEGQNGAWPDADDWERVDSLGIDIEELAGIHPLAFAESVDADLLVYATSANGVYDADPNADPDATQFGSMSPTELVDVVLPMSRDAGASAPVDLLAAKLIDRAGIRSIVLDGTDPSAVVDAVIRGDHTGTDVIPTDAAEPTYWTGGSGA